MTSTEKVPARRRVLRSPWFHVALALTLTLLVVMFVGQPSSSSMSPTLEPGDRLIVNRLAYTFGDPAATGNPLRDAVDGIGEATGIRPYVLVKRVIAGPGQTVECCDVDGGVLVDGEPIAEPYVAKDLPFTPGELDCDSSPASPRCFPLLTVPDDSYLVLGDNRANSADSVYPCRGNPQAPTTCARWMHRDELFGAAGPILWPISRWGGP
jgi:signal peptidase I